MALDDLINIGENPSNEDVTKMILCNNASFQIHFKSNLSPHFLYSFLMFS